MAIALVRSAHAGAMTTNVQTVTVTPSASSNVGTFLLAGVMFTASTATFTAPSGWAQIFNLQVQARTITAFQYPENPGSLASFQFSTTATAGGMSAIVAEFSGLDSIAPFDLSASNNAAGTVTMDSGTTGIISQPIELLIGLLGYAGGSTRTISGITNSFLQDGTNMTVDASSAGAAGAHLSMYYKIAAAQTTAEVSATLSSGTNWLGMMLTFKGTPITEAISDTATFTDTASIFSPVAAMDAATLTDGVNLGTITPASNDTAILTDSMSLGTISPTPNDDGMGNDGVNLGTISPTLSDTALGSDGVTDFISIPLSDVAVLSDGSTITVPIPLAQSGQASDTVLIPQHRQGPALLTIASDANPMAESVLSQPTIATTVSVPSITTQAN